MWAAPFIPCAGIRTEYEVKRDLGDGLAGRLLVAMPENLSSVPRTHKEEGESQLQHVVIL